MRWYNNDGIQSRGLGSNPLGTSTPSLQTPTTNVNQSQGSSEGINLDALTQLLTTGAKVAGTIGAQRAASGAAAQRQARIEACGRKGLGYLFSRRKRDEYQKCIDSANSMPIGGSTNITPPPPPPQRSNTMLFVGIGAVVVIGAVAYFVMRKK